MSEAVTDKINLARHFLNVHDYRKAMRLLREAEQQARQDDGYAYWSELDELLRSTAQSLNEGGPAEHDLSDGGEEWPSH